MLALRMMACKPDSDVACLHVLHLQGPCASHHLAWSLWHGGIHADHESIDVDGSVSWMLAVDDRCCAPNNPYGIKKAPNRYPGPAKEHFNRHHGDVFNKVVLIFLICPACNDPCKGHFKGS